MNVDISTLDAKAVESYAQAAEQQSVTDFLLNLIPTMIGPTTPEGKQAARAMPSSTACLRGS